MMGFDSFEASANPSVQPCQSTSPFHSTPAACCAGAAAGVGGEGAGCCGAPAAGTVAATVAAGRGPLAFVFVGPEPDSQAVTTTRPAKSNRWTDFTVDA